MTISDAQIALQRRAARLVECEVHACMSSLVATLAKGAHFNMVAADLSELTEQAMELASPVLDYEGAAREAGWTRDDCGILNTSRGEANGTGDEAEYADTWEDACDISQVEPHENEVYEHWAVSQWLAEKLTAKGERVDTDFAGLNVWARTTTGQAISADSVIEAITEETGYASVPGPDMFDGEA